VIRRGIPDRFIEHAERNDLLAELGLDAAGIVAAVRQRVGAHGEVIGS